MKFSNAAILLSEGKRIRRRSWEDGGWIGKMGFNMYPSIDYADLCSDDWEILDCNSVSFLVETYEEMIGKPEW